VLVPSADAAVPIARGTMLPLCFISDVFQPIDNAPHWLRAIASAFPLRPFADVTWSRRSTRSRAAGQSIPRIRS